MTNSQILIDLYKRYKTEVVTIDPGNVKTNMNPKGYLNAEKCSEYILNLVKGEDYPQYKNGIPQYAKLKKTLI